ncbi:MAG TPA: cytidylate kinase family protein [Burkholderiales bacterium]|nr:cytidylate kinase family protein [Burkholderiales bacterium]
MPVVTVTREMGSQGKEVARGVSEALGVPLICHQIVDQLADRVRLRKSQVMRLLDGRAGIFERMSADLTSLAIFAAEEIVNAALQDNGAVIRGWGATQLLREMPSVVCVRVCAPFEVRKQRMLERLGAQDADKVAEDIRNNDEAYAAITRRHFSVDYTDPEKYDLVLNTQRVGVAECVDQVLRLVRSAEFAETESARQQLHDFGLVCRVRAALRRSPRTRDMRVTVKVQNGRVAFGGAGYGADRRAALSEVAAAVPGVREIEDLSRTISLRARFA